MSEIILYSTWGCHLCEQAEQLFAELNLQSYVRVVDIVDDEEAFSRYRVSIPVVSKGGHELFWPFDKAQLKMWLKDVS